MRHLLLLLELYFFSRALIEISSFFLLNTREETKVARRRQINRLFSLVGSLLERDSCLVFWLLGRRDSGWLLKGSVLALGRLTHKWWAVLAHATRVGENAIVKWFRAIIIIETAENFVGRILVGCLSIGLTPINNFHWLVKQLDWHQLFCHYWFIVIHIYYRAVLFI